MESGHVGKELLISHFLSAFCYLDWLYVENYLQQVYARELDRANPQKKYPIADYFPHEEARESLSLFELKKTKGAMED